MKIMLSQLELHGIVNPTAAITGGELVTKPINEADVESLGQVPVEFFWNGKPNGDILLREIDQWMTKNSKIVSLGLSSKLRPTSPASEDLLTAVSQRAQLVVTGPGD